MVHAQPDCVFCGYRDAPVHLQRPRFAIRRCPHCTVLWCDPIRFDEALGQDDEQANLSTEATLHTENATRLHHLLRHTKPEVHPRLLEVGCSHSDFIDQARGAGFEARDVAALDSSITDDSLDVVAAFDVIEHMERPDQFLDQVARTLRPGGVLIVETPAQESVHHHVAFLRGRLAPERDTDVGVFPGARMFEFGRRSWTTILRDRGFEILQIEPRSTPMRELLASNRADPIRRAGIVGVGLLGRLTGLENRVLVVARSLAQRSS